MYFSDVKGQQSTRENLPPVVSSTISRRLISSLSTSRKVMSASTLSTPSAIISAIRPAFDKGIASGDLLFFPSQVHTHKDKELAIDVSQTRKNPRLSLSLSWNASVTNEPPSFSAVRDQAMPSAAAETRHADPAL